MHQNHPTELIVALDFPRMDQALKVVEQLQGLPVIYKVGVELFMGCGPEIVRELAHQKARVFLDLKFNDMPHIVARAVKQAALLHVEMLSLHLSGGSAMFRAISAEFAEVSSLKPKLLGVSVLPSFDDVHWAEVTRALTGHAVEVDSSVSGLLNTMSLWGLDGMFCSPSELEETRKLYPSMYLAVSGVRLSEDLVQDPLRITIPSQAKTLGADAIIMGQPITRASDPRSVAEAILNELSSTSVKPRKSAQR